MQPIMIEDLVRWSGGRLLCGNSKDCVTSVSINSREIAPGSLFVPIVGEKVNAHRFIDSAFKAGAAAVLTQEQDAAQGDKVWIRVDDTLQALQDIAAAYRGLFTIPVVGITGSVGKTSTKEMVAAALSVEKRVMKTAGNFNSQIGLPLTMFQLEKEHQAAVIEMGMSQFGEMSKLSAIARPDYAILTNIGISHIEQLKTQENIRAEKLHIMDQFGEQGTLYLNVDDPLLAEMMGKLPVRTIGYGIKQDCNYQAKQVESDGERTWFSLQGPNGARQMVIPAIGEHHVLNALAAIAVATDLGLSPESIQKGLLCYQNAAMRQQIHRMTHFTLIDDSYNASPDSAKSGLSVLAQVQKTGRKIAVLADMLELGDQSEQAHYQLGQLCAQMGVDLLISVGPRAEAIARGAMEQGVAVEVCASNGEAFAYLKEQLQPGDAILVKGSRGMHTDEIVNDLMLLEKTIFL
ncbi:MAG: UDP-N-acetylmuramoyl-tripeptide--D-alanyl-D-alanine ligase [Clostridiales bacterium]|jgi:UDP-N-acetylmuramoyl-tripeptide--D-alanyl-D-alanine ligase|nr:UDP-N-acetylmuramoyl-tripeptide--D-alanyl-D-alanine ligase [Clostridiales bacterium]